MSLEQDLKSIGLEEKEAKVYLAALELGPTSIQNLTEKSGIKRSTVYEMIKNLEKKGLVSETSKGKRRLMVASEPERLKQSITAKERLLKEILPELKSLNNIGNVKPIIRYYEGKEGLRQIYKDTLTTKNKLTLWISPIQSMLETIGEDFLNSYVEERTSLGIWVNSVYITSQRVEDYKYLNPTTFEKTLRRIRFTSPDINIKNAMCIYGNKVAIISSRKEGFGFVMESADYAETMRVFHNLLWNISKPWGDMNFDNKAKSVENKETEIEDDYWK
ncbi:MAG: helix-turn-helix domain-containing protein [Parcubacteria group bacterium]